MYGGKINLGYLTYTKIRFWGEQTLATPNERYNGDYIAQVLTPSRLKKNTICNQRCKLTCIT